MHEEAHTNVRLISCDGHQLYERGVDLVVEARACVIIASEASFLYSLFNGTDFFYIYNIYIYTVFPLLNAAF